MICWTALPAFHLLLEALSIFFRCRSASREGEVFQIMRSHKFPVLDTQQILSLSFPSVQLEIKGSCLGSGEDSISFLPSLVPHTVLTSYCISSTWQQKSSTKHTSLMGKSNTFTWSILSKRQATRCSAQGVRSCTLHWELSLSQHLRPFGAAGAGKNSLCQYQEVSAVILNT